MWSSASASWWGRGGPSAHAHALVGFFPVSQRTLLGVLGGVFWGAQLWLLSHAHLAAAGRAIQGYTVLEYSSTHFGFQTVIFLYVQKAVQLCVWYHFLRIRKDDGLETEYQLQSVVLRPIDKRGECIGNSAQMKMHADRTRANIHSLNAVCDRSQGAINAALCAFVAEFNEK